MRLCSSIRVVILNTTRDLFVCYCSNTRYLINAQIVVRYSSVFLTSPRPQTVRRSCYSPFALLTITKRETATTQHIALFDPFQTHIYTAFFINMHLMYFLDANGKRIYTLKKDDAAGIPSKSAHPARFSPDDKFSKERIACKTRFGLLPTQIEGKEY